MVKRYRNKSIMKLQPRTDNICVRCLLPSRARPSQCPYFVAQQYILPAILRDASFSLCVVTSRDITISSNDELQWPMSKALVIAKGRTYITYTIVIIIMMTIIIIIKLLYAVLRHISFLVIWINNFCFIGVWMKARQFAVQKMILIYLLKNCFILSLSLSLFFSFSSREKSMFQSLLLILKYTHFDNSDVLFDGR